jgi:hypothetical protein
MQTWLPRPARWLRTLTLGLSLALQATHPLLPRTRVVGLGVKRRFHYGFIFETLDKTGLVWFE